jgi:hypothetical protein
MGLITPVPSADIGAWGTKLNTLFGQVDAHDHTAGKGVQVPTGGINIDADMAWNGKALTNLGKLAFSSVAALTSGAISLFVNIADNELYWRTAAGANVKMTNGAGLNMSLVGGIGGDYSTAGATLAYDDSNKRYTFKTQTSTWARLASGPVRIYEFNTNESVYVEHAVDATLAAPYTVTWPAALPGSQAAMQVTAAGAVVFSNTFTSAITATEYKLSANAVLTIPPSMYKAQRGGTAVIGDQTFAGNSWSWGNHTGSKLYIPIPLKTGDRLNGFAVHVIKLSDATNTITVDLYKVTWTVGGITGHTVPVVTKTRSDNAPGPVIISTVLDPDLHSTLSSVDAFYLEVSMSDATPSLADIFLHTYAYYDHP